VDQNKSADEKPQRDKTSILANPNSHDWMLHKSWPNMCKGVQLMWQHSVRPSSLHSAMQAAKQPN